MNQTKEDMKSLQSDLACADKEISVRQIKQICVYLCRMCVVVISVCKLSTEPEEESGVSSEISEHTNEDKRSRQSAHL